MKYKMIFDYHTHSTFSHGLTRFTPHGKGTIEENAKAAVAKGLSAIAVSEHGPGHLTYGIQFSQVPLIREEIRRVQALVPALKIYLSVEANICSGTHSLDITPEQANEFDFLLGGYHLAVRRAYATSNFLLTRGVFTWEGRTNRGMIRNTDLVIRALHQNNLRILTHPGDKAPMDILEIAKACEQTDTWMEISNFHSNLTVDQIKIAATTDVKFVISSDAHSPQRIGSYQKGLARALESGLDPERIVNIKPCEECE